MGPNFIFAPRGLAVKTLRTSFSAAASLHSVFDSSLMKMSLSFSGVTFVPPNVNSEITAEYLLLYPGQRCLVGMSR